MFSRSTAIGVEYKRGILEAVYGWQYEYTLTDHVGNARASFCDLDGNGSIEVTNGSDSELLQTQTYYPFGTSFSGTNSPQSGTPKTMGFGMMFIHEGLHTDAGTGNPHGKEAYTYGYMGTIVGATNTIRQQLGDDYGIRSSYLAYEKEGSSYLPFDKTSGQIIGTHIINYNHDMQIR